MQIAKWNEQTQTPYDIRDRYSVLANGGSGGGGNAAAGTGGVGGSGVVIITYLTP